MSQTTDTTLADQSGASFRTELNGILSALNTDFSGSTAPVTPEAYMVWQDTSVTPNVLRRRNGANSAWEIYPVVEGATNAAAAKTTPVDADILPLGDSAASFGLKKLSWLNIKATLKTYFDTLYLSKAGDTLTGLLKFANGANIASAATVNLSTATGNTVKITGTTTINAWTMTSGQVMDVIFTDVLTLTHNATTNNLNSGGSNITTATNDRARIYYDGAVVWVLNYTRADGTALVGSRMLLTASQATTSGTAIDFTGIPSWAKKITLTFYQVSTNGASDYLAQLGTSTGVVTSGYTSTGTSINQANGTSGSSSTAGFVMDINAAANITSGHLVFALLSNNTWVCSGTVKKNSTEIQITSGDVIISSTLYRIRLTTVNGTDTFDGGSVSLLIEGY